MIPRGPSCDNHHTQHTHEGWYISSHIIPASHFICNPVFFLASLLLVGLIETNPGPAVSHGSLADYQSKSGLKVCYQNANHLWSKRNDFGLLVSQTKSPLVLGVAETWLDEDHAKNLLDIPGMKQYRYDRTGANLSLGMSVYISKELKHTVPVVTKGHSHTVAYTDIKYQQENIRAVFVYRRPVQRLTNRFLADYNDLMDTICETNAQLVIMGDFNLDLKRTPPSAHSRTLIELNMGHGLTQLVDETTHVQGDSQTIIDHIYMDVNVLTHNILIANEMCQLNCGDHNLIGVNFLSKENIPRAQHKHEYKMVLDYSKCDFDRMKILLAAPRFWDPVYVCNDLNGKWELFEKRMMLILSLCCPTKRQRLCCQGIFTNRFGNRWYTSEFDIEKKTLGFIYTYCKDIMKFQAGHEMWRYYKNRRTKYFKDVRNAHRQYDIDLIRGSETIKKKQQNVKKIMGKAKTDSQIDKISYGGQDHTSKQGISNAFNNFFATVGVEAANAAAEELPGNIHFTPTPGFSFRPPGFYQTYLYLNQIDTSKPAGPGGVPGSIFKTLAPCLMFVLEHIFSHCIYRSEVPRSWKFAHVTPIYKEKGSQSDPGNYRPIAITSIISKVFEKLIYDQLIEHLERNGCLSNRQYGYRRKRSTAYAVTDLVEKVRRLQDSRGRKFVGALMLDLSKAFDCLAHHLLLKMLPRFGMCDNSTRLIASYLTGRKQCVKIGFFLSDEKELTCGVPQGSLLGPILFDMYVNSICDQIDAFVVQYADDTAVVRRANSLEQLYRLLIQDLLTLSAFFKSLGLKLNVGKTDFLVFGCNGPGEHILLLPDGTRIAASQEVKYLGVYIDSKLKFDKQNKTRLNTLRQSVKTMRAIRGHVTQDVAIDLLHATFYCYTDYCDFIWKQSPDTVVSKKCEVQHRYMLRAVFKRGVTTHTAELYLASGAITLDLRSKMHLLQLVYRIVNGDCPVEWASFFRISRNGEPTKRLVVESVQSNNATSFVSNTIQRTGARLWNNLKTDARLEPTMSIFKRRLWRYCWHKMRQQFDDGYPSDAEDY